MPASVELQLQQFNRIDKALNDLYHETALSLGLSDSAFLIFYLLHTLGDGCLQRDICREAFVSKQTVHSSAAKLERDGFLRLAPGRGRDKHLFLTAQGRAFVQSHIAPVIRAEHDALASLTEQERDALLRLYTKYTDGLRRQLAACVADRP